MATPQIMAKTNPWITAPPNMNRTTKASRVVMEVIVVRDKHDDDVESLSELETFAVRIVDILVGFYWISQQGKCFVSQICDTKPIGRSGGTPTSLEVSLVKSL